MAGVSPFEIVFAQIATQIFVLIGQTAVALLMTLVVFGISCEGSIGIVIAVTLLQGVAGMCYGKWGYDSKKTDMEIGFNFLIALIVPLKYQFYPLIIRFPSFNIIQRGIYGNASWSGKLLSINDVKWNLMANRR